MALLRERLAKEQQRARAAEATLAAQQQVQQLLQSAVQAVLLARISAQVCWFCNKLYLFGLKSKRTLLPIERIVLSAGLHLSLICP